MTPDELLHKIQSGEYRLAFHGTAQLIHAFTERGVGRGADRNSALGLFLSEIPDSAADYAQMAYEAGEGDAARVYVVAVPCAKAFQTRDYERFFGLDDDHVPTRTFADFSAWRRQLLNDGYDLIEFEGVGDVINVCLAPQRAIVVACLDYEQAIELEEEGVQLFDSESIYRHLIECLPNERIMPQTPRIAPSEGLQP
jgi:hypothetical protein